MLEEYKAEESENSILPFSQNEMKDKSFPQNDTVLGNIAGTQERENEENEEREIPSKTSLLSSQNSMDLESDKSKTEIRDESDTYGSNLGEEKSYTSSSESSEKNTKLRPEG